MVAAVVYYGEDDQHHVYRRFGGPHPERENVQGKRCHTHYVHEPMPFHTGANKNGR